MNDFRALIHELLVQKLSVSAFMQELIAAHETVQPNYKWGPLKRQQWEESDELLARWLIPTLREPPHAKGIQALWVGLYQPIRAGEVVTDMYLAGSRDFELNAVPCRWNVAPAYRPASGDACSGVLAQLYRNAYGEAGRPGNDAENYLGLGYASKAIATLLSRISPAMLLGGRKSMWIATGWDSGSPLYVGHCDLAGFSPRPLAEALLGLETEEVRWARYQEDLAARERASRRCFLHPDGRRWSVMVAESCVTLEFIDIEGEEHTRTRFRELVEEDMAAVAESLVQEQLADGFVEVGSGADDP